jgi:hypothetical protein
LCRYSVEEASMSMQRTMEKQLAAEAARRIEAEALVTETMDAIREVEDAKLELRKSAARAEERHAAQMAEFRAEVQADSVGLYKLISVDLELDVSTLENL